jgi:hypothetical protein
MKIATAVVNDTLIVLLLSFINAWAVMVLVGVAHSTDGRIPTFGYWTVYVLVMALSIVVSSASREETKS